MKKTLALVLAIVMALGCMSITAFAEVSGNGTFFNPYLLSKLAKGDKIIIQANSYLHNDTANAVYVTGLPKNGKLDAGNKSDLVNNRGCKVGDVVEVTGISEDRISFVILNANITAEITAADFGYIMVIPTATTLTEGNHENVLLGTDGKVSIKDVKHPTDKVNVVYTVDLTNGNLTDGTTTINATYKYKQGDADFAAIDGTTKVTVYENETIVDSYVNVTANDEDWKNAPAGNYSASVVFNFEKVEMVKVSFGTAEDSYNNFAFEDKDENPVTYIMVPKGTTYSIEPCGRTLVFSNGMEITVYGAKPEGLLINKVDNSNYWDEESAGVFGTINADTLFEFYDI